MSSQPTQELRAEKAPSARTISGRDDPRDRPGVCTRFHLARLEEITGHCAHVDVSSLLLEY